MRRHFVAGAAIDDDRFGAHALGRARDVDRGVAAAIDDDAATEHWFVLAFHAAQHGNGVDDFRHGASGDVGPLADVRADGEERGVELAGLHRFLDVVDLGVEPDLDAHVDDALHLGIEHVARQTILRNAEAHHAAHQRAGLAHGDLVAKTAQVIRGRHAGGAGADDQNALAGFGSRLGEFPATLDRLVAEKAFNGIDTHRRIELPAITGALAGVITNPPHDRREGIVAG